MLTESGNVHGDGALSANFGPGGDTRLVAMEDGGEDLTKGKVFAKGVKLPENPDDEEL